MNPSHAPARRARRRRAGLGLALAAALAVGATACGSADNGDSDSVADVSTTQDTKQGIVLDRPFEKPDLVLTDTKGKEYDLIEETQGKPTVIYFGYTHCPDVCSPTMSNIDIAKRALPKADQDNLKVIFVTTDPERDTPESLDKWLAAVAPGTVGLTGDFDTIQAASRSLGMAIDAPVKKKNGEILSQHGTQVFAFSPKDDKAHVIYPNDAATVENFEKDFPKLMKGQHP
ncbi:SCO family protein [Streptomyces gobiensis]|uniref:SCO family protein n=1 Tax=Streptomyces gobiensis TaxID=2875706 RepID=UPI001E64837E|nr:SCO family protein [Streptomyces gobiensis]UGY92487.1 SCO family protein [Streptomyces gobiensis]